MQTSNCPARQQGGREGLHSPRLYLLLREAGSRKLHVRVTRRAARGTSGGMEGAAFPHCPQALLGLPSQPGTSAESGFWGPQQSRSQGSQQRLCPDVGVQLWGLGSTPALLLLPGWRRGPVPSWFLVS